MLWGQMMIVWQSNPGSWPQHVGTVTIKAITNTIDETASPSSHEEPGEGLDMNLQAETLDGLPLRGGTVHKATASQGHRAVS